VEPPYRGSETRRQANHDGDGPAAALALLAATAGEFLRLGAVAVPAAVVAATGGLWLALRLLG
jgi:hypothetical protein